MTEILKINEIYLNYIESNKLKILLILNVLIKQCNDLLKSNRLSEKAKNVVLKLRWFLKIRINLQRKRSHVQSLAPQDAAITKNYANIWTGKEKEFAINLLNLNITNLSAYVEAVTKLKNFMQDNFLESLEKNELSTEIELLINKAMSFDNALLSFYKEDAHFNSNFVIMKNNLKDLFQRGGVLTTSEFYLKHFCFSKEFYYSLNEEQKENERYSSAINKILGFTTKKFY